MVTLRCTRRLLRRLGTLEAVDAPVPTTTLGDWYCSHLLSRPEPLVMCMNERTLLAVLVRTDDFSDLPRRFRGEVASLLARIGVPPGDIIAEEYAMGTLGFAQPASRQVLGCLNEARIALSGKFGYSVAQSIRAAEDDLARRLYSPTRGRYPMELALELFAVRRLVTETSVAWAH